MADSTQSSESPEVVGAANLLLRVRHSDAPRPNTAPAALRGSPVPEVTREALLQELLAVDQGDEDALVNKFTVQRHVYGEGHDAIVDAFPEETGYTTPPRTSSMEACSPSATSGENQTRSPSPPMNLQNLGIPESYLAVWPKDKRDLRRWGNSNPDWLFWSLVGDACRQVDGARNIRRRLGGDLGTPSEPSIACAKIMPGYIPLRDPYVLDVLFGYEKFNWLRHVALKYDIMKKDKEPSAEPEALSNEKEVADVVNEEHNVTLELVKTITPGALKRRLDDVVSELRSDDESDNPALDAAIERLKLTLPSPTKRRHVDMLSESYNADADDELEDAEERHVDMLSESQNAEVDDELEEAEKSEEVVKGCSAENTKERKDSALE